MLNDFRVDYTFHSRVQINYLSERRYMCFNSENKIGKTFKSASSLSGSPERNVSIRIYND